MTGERILVVDDEPQIQRFLKPALEAGGYEAVVVSSAAEALATLVRVMPDLVLLDLGLPDLDGKDLIREIRRWSALPVIVLSARDRESEKIAALDLGADDYVNKPFGVGELLARIRASLRLRAGTKADVAPPAAAGLVVDPVKHQARKHGRPLHLTPKEFDLLLLLVRNAGKVMTHRQILTAIWGPAHGEDVQYLRVFIGQLRQKIEDNPTEPALVLTEPGIGYRLAADD